MIQGFKSSSTSVDGLYLNGPYNAKFWPIFKKVLFERERGGGGGSYKFD